MTKKMLWNLGSGLVALGFLVGVAGTANTEVVANLGTLTIGSSETTGCNTTSCTASVGSVGGSLPNSGVFSHQVVFKVDIASGSINSAQALNRTFYDIANVTFQLFEQTGGSVAVGGTATGILLATAAFDDFGLSRNYFLSFGVLDPAKTYYVQFSGTGSGVTNTGASYTTQVSISAVPLPPAVFLLGAALAGLVGFARVRWNKNKATA